MLLELVTVEAALVGHVAFSALALDPPSPSGTVAALAPLAVAPERQRHGLGSALVRAGLAACRARGVAAIVVLGDPVFYPRFGFATSTAARLRAPFAGPGLMAIELAPGALPDGAAVRYPAAFEVGG